MPIVYLDIDGKIRASVVEKGKITFFDVDDVILDNASGGFSRYGKGRFAVTSPCSVMEVEVYGRKEKVLVCSPTKSKEEVAKTVKYL